MSFMHSYPPRRRRLRKTGIRTNEAFLVTNITNVAYLTGFSGSAGWLLVSKNKEILISDTRYEAQLAEQCSDLDCVIRNANSTNLDALADVVAKAGFQQIKFEADSIAKSVFDQMESKLPYTELIPTSGVVETIRSVKDKSEIELIRESIRINERAVEVIRSQLRADQTELEVAHNLEHQMRAFGAKGVSFDPIVAVGPRAALPHAFPTDKRIGSDKLILIDWGTSYRGYASDLTRILMTSKIPPKLRKIYNVVLEAQLKAIKKIKPGVTLKAVDSAARNVIESAGYGKYFGHGLGHSLGLEIHESPFLSPIRKGKLESGMVVTIEPGIYIPGWGGVRIEDDVLVTQNGHEVLSNLPKDIDECVVDLI